MTRALVDSPAPPRRRRIGTLLVAPVGLAVGTVAALVVAAAWPTPAAPDAVAADPGAVAADPLGVRIANVQTQVGGSPGNADAWAELGVLYVQEAENTVNPAYYPKADSALARSLALDPDANLAALGGLAALRGAQHRFAESRDLAQQALTIDPESSALYGTLADADAQLGRYAEAHDAVQHLLDRHPDVSSLAVAADVDERTGGVDDARDVLRQALAAASSPADVAFCRYRIAELALSGGDPADALRQIQLATAADPHYPDLLAGQAKAEAALGQTEVAFADYQRLVQSVPKPQYLVEAGEFFESVGLMADAQQAYGLFAAQTTLFTANGVPLDTGPALFYADHGDPAQALRYAEAGLQTRPSGEMQDAYAWALFANGRDVEALASVEKATSTGMRNAMFSFHQGMIENSLGQRDAARTDLIAALVINPYFSPRLVPIAHATLTTLGGPR